MTIEQIEAEYPARSFRNHYTVRAYWVPIALRKEVLCAYASAGIPVRLRYRGSRVESVGRAMPRIKSRGGFYSRTRSQANQDCLIDDATHFTAYARQF